MITQFIRKARRTFKVGVGMGKVGLGIGAAAGAAYGVAKLIKWKRAPEPMLVPVPQPPRRVPTPAPAPDATTEEITETAPAAGGAAKPDAAADDIAESAPATSDASGPEAEPAPAKKGKGKAADPAKSTGKRVSTGTAKSPNKARVVTGNTVESEPAATEPASE